MGGNTSKSNNSCITTNDYIKTRTDLSKLTGRELMGDNAIDFDRLGFDPDAPATCRYYDVASECSNKDGCSEPALDFHQMQLTSAWCTQHREGNNPCFLDTTAFGKGATTNDGRPIIAYCKAYSGNDGSGQ